MNFTVELGSRKFSGSSLSDALAIDETWSMARAGQVTITYDISTYSEDERVNLAALVQKTSVHLRFVLGHEDGRPISHPVWRKFWRNAIDRTHGEGVSFDQFCQQYFTHHGLAAIVTLTERAIAFHAELESSAAIAAATGRLFNLVDWPRKWTREVKLMSSSPIKWDTFDQITLYGLLGIKKLQRR